MREETSSESTLVDENGVTPTLSAAVGTNTQLLRQLLDEVVDLRELVDDARCEGIDPSSAQAASDPDAQQLRDRVEQLEDYVAQLEQQNSDLASQLASSNVKQSVARSNSCSTEALSWEERKQLILEQMEDESFDAEQFVSSLQGDSEQDAQSESPSEFVQRLHEELDRRDKELSRRDEELQNLRFLLDQQTGARGGGVAVGAAAIAEMVDADELVRQERERLQRLQAEWEEKFREGEIEASLERAKLSRERQELAKKQEELEEQLEHLRRESRQSEGDGSGTSRRWMAKLGLSGDG